LSKTQQYDVTVIGAGLIGLSTAMHLLERHPDLRVCVIEKDPHPASQQSGHNSGVIHSGIYYKPGSFKSRFCVEGRASMTQFCIDNQIPTWTCGKLIVATREEEIPRLQTLLERGTANKVEGLELVGPERIREIEPHVRAIKALWAPGTGIVDFRKVARVYLDKVRQRGGEVHFNTRARKVINHGGETILETDAGEFNTRNVVNCAGLHSDVVAKMMGVRPNLRIIPFRGEYYTLIKEKEYLVKGLIYPVPDPDFPFLGVHFTQTMKEMVEAGPNAVLATKREGYRKRDISLVELADILGYAGFWRLALREWKIAAWEINRSFRKSVFVKSLQQLIPEVTSDDLGPGGSGVRAQAVAPDGSLLDDFRIEQTPNAVHVLNAPSPGATSSLVIGRYIVDLAEQSFSLR
jgi:L-2-hydroxyglutarate oxidase